MRLLIIGSVLNLWAFFHFKIYYDAAQLLQKGLLFSQHSIITFYGNKATNAGFVPGGLLTLLSGLPLMIHDNPLFPMVLILILQFGAYLLIDNLLKKQATTTHRMWWVLLFWLNPWRILTSYLWNPAYLFFYSALHFWSADKMQKKHFGYTFLHGCAIGLAFQTHLSFIILLLISFFLLGYKKIKFHLGAVFCFILIFLITLWPYFQMLLTNNTHSIGLEKSATLGFGLLKIYPFIKGVLYWLRYNSFLFAEPSFKVNFLWLNSGSVGWFLSNTFIVMASFIGGLSMVVVIYCQYFFIKRLSVSPKIYAYVKAAFYSLVVISAITPIIFSHWDLFLIFIPAQMTVLFSAVEYLKLNPYYSNRIYTGVSIYFIAFTVFSVLGSKHFSVDNNVLEQYQHGFQQGQIK